MMTKQEYLNELKAELNKNAVADADDIITEYEQHFLFKLADGFSEEQVAQKLGQPAQIATQYAGIPAERKRKGGKKAFLVLWLGLIGIFEFLLYGAFLSFIVALFGASLVPAAFGAELIAGVNYWNLLPPMPYAGAVVMGIMLLAASVILFVSGLFCLAYLKQMVRASLRWRKNLMSDEALPPLPLSPQFSPKGRRTLRTVFLWAVLIYGTTFVLGYTILALHTHTMAFWHALGWFGYPPTVY
jgi:uncharacterized membrane protein